MVMNSLPCLPQKQIKSGWSQLLSVIKYIDLFHFAAAEGIQSPIQSNS